MTVRAGDKIHRLPNREHRPKIQRNSPVLARGTGNFLEPIGNIRLSLQIKIHVGVDRKSIKTIPAYSFPFTIFRDTPAIDPKAILFTNRTVHFP